MHLVLDPAQDAAHGGWLRDVPGAYEWWYFDAISDDAVWSLACIWFLGNPFSPYYRLSAQGASADPYTHNALFFALHRKGALYAYHFTRFPRAHICADEQRPAALQFGPNSLSHEGGVYRLLLADENANRRRLTADLKFVPPAPNSGGAGEDRSLLAPPELGAGGRSAPPELGAGGGSGADTHFWLPAAPACRVNATLTLREAHNLGVERVAFTGDGYHDHNWGTLPFAADIQDWYWARAALGGGRVAVVYHVNSHTPHTPVSHLVLFERGRMTHHDPQAVVTLGRPRVNVFGTRYATRLDVRSGGIAATFWLGHRLDSSPFYVRVLSHATVTQDGRTALGGGMGEYFRPRLLGNSLVASATKARIVAA